MSSLEGFSENIRGHRSLIIGEAKDWLSRIHMLESESLYKGRSIMVIHENVRGGPVAPCLFRKRWDCVFRIRDAFEAQMLATYVANAPKPVRVLWTSASQQGGPGQGPGQGQGGQEIPRSLWQRWSVGGDVTLIGGSGGDLMGCEWETIFFPLQNTPQFTDRVLSQRGTGIRTLVQLVAAHFGDIAESGAALVWSNIDEKDVRGCLYWYDPKGTVGVADTISKAEAVSMLEDVIGILR
jgi:hypothetical protein